MRAGRARLRFFSYVITALQTLDQEIGSTSLAHLRETSLEQQAYLQLLLAALNPSRRFSSKSRSGDSFSEYTSECTFRYMTQVDIRLYTLNREDT
jgi:hypothetical protein